MKVDVGRHVSRCTCHLNKANNTKRHAPLQPLHASAPFEHIHVYHVGPFEKTDKEHLYALMMVDRFTKWMEIAAVKEKDMSEAADKFEKKIVARWGAPATVMADNAFKGIFAEMSAKYGVDLKEMIPHQHNSNGLAERNNRMLRKSLRSYINDEQDDWDQLLPRIQFAMNTSNAKEHKESP